MSAWQNHADDVSGWDFINYDSSPQAGELNPNGSGTTHGTLVAGVAAATGNNGKGIAGSDWGTKILPLQAMDDDSYGNTGSVGKAIYYAITQHADVISLSLGSSEPDALVEEAVRAASAAGIVVVAAAGNDGCDCMVYPARYPEVVSVGALNASSQRASFSSWGDNLDIMAPGTNMTSSVWGADNPTTAYASGVNGTSFSAPMVSGMMTRMLSQQPNATPLQLIAAVTENTNRLALAATTPHDILLGFGTLDAAKASQRMTLPTTSLQVYSFDPVSHGNYLPSQPGQPWPYEKQAPFQAYQCSGGTVGTTPIYELAKAGGSFFTVSPAEAGSAISRGYTRNLFAYGCLSQPQDDVGAVRNINIYKEFRNDYSKP
jgi:subtilisin family serine protease